MNDANPIGRYAVLLRRWWPVLAAALAASLVIGLTTLPEPPRDPTAEGMADPSVPFRATHLLLANEDSPAAVRFDLLVILAGQGDLTNRIVERFDGDVQAADAESILLEPNPDIGTLAITAIQPSPELAAELTMIYAEELNALLEERVERELVIQIERVRERVATLSARIDTLEGELAGVGEGDTEAQLLEAELEETLQQYGAAQTQLRDLEDEQQAGEPAFETLQPPSPVPADQDEDEATLSLPRGTMPRLVLFSLVALALGVGAVLAVDRIDTRLRTRRDAEEAFGLPVIAELPRRARGELDRHPVAAATDPDGVTAEAFRRLRLSLLVGPRWRLSGMVPIGNGAVGTVAPAAPAGEPTSFVVTSPLMGDGKSTVAANLAASFAELGMRALIVDCDFRRPAVGSIIGAPPGSGLRSLRSLEGASLEDLVVETGVERVRMLPSGDEPGIAPSWFLAEASSLVLETAALADVVVFDTGPLPLTNEAATLIPWVDSTILVARGGKVSWDAARDSLALLSRVTADVAGVVLVGGERSRRYEGYYASVRPPHRARPDEEEASRNESDKSVTSP